MRKAISCVASAAMVVAFAPTITMPAVAFADDDPTYQNAKGISKPSSNTTYDSAIPSDVSDAYKDNYTTIGRIPVGVDCDSTNYPTSQPTFKLRYSTYLYYGVKDTKLTVFSINDLGTPMPDYNYEDQGYYAVKGTDGKPTEEVKEIFGSNNHVNGKYNFYYDGYGKGEVIESVDASSVANHLDATKKIILNTSYGVTGYSTSKTLCWALAPWYKDNSLKTINSVEIADSVTHVGKLNFANVNEIKSYKIDNPQVTISDEAFYTNTKDAQVSISLPDGVTWKNSYAHFPGNAKLTVTNSAVENFKTTYADILAKTPNATLTEAEQVQVANALHAYESLSESAKELLASEHETLVLLSQTEFETTTSSAVPSAVSKAYSEYGTIYRMPTGAVYENDELVLNYRSDLYYGIKDDGNGGKAWTVFSIKPDGSAMPDYNYETQGYVKDENGKYVEVYCPTGTGTVTHDGKACYDYYYVSDPTKLYKSVAKTDTIKNHAEATASICANGTYNSNGGYSTGTTLCYICAPWWAKKNDISSLTFDESINRIGKLNVVYNTDSSKQLKTIEVKNKNCKFSNDAFFAQKNEAGVTLIAPYSALSATDSNWSNAENNNAKQYLAVSYTEALGFKAKYSELWNLSYESATDDQKSKAAAALTEYNSFADAIKNQLTDEQAKLTELTHNGLPTSGTIDSKFDWKLIDNGKNGYKLYVTGAGKFALPSTAIPWSSYVNEITDVILGEGITGVASGVFSNLINLESVGASSTIEKGGIDAGAFPDKEFVIKGWYNHEGIQSYLEKNTKAKLQLKELRVLAVGNSHTQDYTTFLGKAFNTMANAGVNTKVTVDTIIYGGRPVSTWLSNFDEDIAGSNVVKGKTYDLVIFQDYQESTIPAKKDQLINDMKSLISKAKGTFGSYAKYAWFADWIDTLAIGNDQTKLDAAYASSTEAMTELVNATDGVDFVIPASTVALNAAQSYLGTTKNADGALKNWYKGDGSKKEDFVFTDHADNYYNYTQGKPNNGDTHGEYGPLSYYNLLFRDRTHMSLEIGRQLMAETAVYGILNGFNNEIFYAEGSNLDSAFDNAQFTTPSYGKEGTDGCYWEGSIDEAPEIWSIYKTAVKKSYEDMTSVTTGAKDYPSDPLQNDEAANAINETINRAVDESKTTGELLKNTSSEVSKLTIGGSSIRLAKAELTNATAATCTAKATCTLNLTLRRGYSTRTVALENVEVGSALGHTMTKTDAKAATCTVDGNVEYWTCNACGKKFSDAAGTTEIADDKVIIKAHHTLTAHTAVAATCGKAGNIAYWSCSVCNKLFSDDNATREIASKDTVIAATGKHSYKNGTCTVCGAKDPNYSTGGGTYVPTPTPKPDPTPTPDEPSQPDTPKAPAVGDTLTTSTGTGQLHFTVTGVASASGKGGTVAFTGCNGSAGSVSVPATVEIDGVTYTVTEIAPYAFKDAKKLAKVTVANTIVKIGKGAFEGCKNLKSVTIGGGVKTIGKSAFKGCKRLTSITVTSKHLTKKSVKGSLKGSAVKTIVVKVGSKKANKTYAKKYGKIFTKKIAGKKASVKASKKSLKK